MTMKKVDKLKSKADKLNKKDNFIWWGDQSMYDGCGYWMNEGNEGNFIFLGRSFVEAEETLDEMYVYGQW